MEEIKDIKLADKRNEYDPKVVFDPTFDKSVAIKNLYQADLQSNSRPLDTVNPLKDDGINLPIVRMNNIILMNSQIDYVSIDYRGFLPTLHLSVRDNKKYIRTIDTPGMDNEIVIVITAPINGYYKKINLAFYITDIKIYGNYISYDAIFKYPKLNKAMFKQIGSDKLNTYELLYEISKETGLGFAATPSCKEVEDKRYRRIQSRTYLEFIKDQLSFSGIENTSIFDAWVDLQGYLTMVNVPYIMDCNIKWNEISIFTMVGHHSSEDLINDVNAIEIPRILTNNRINHDYYNMLFTEHEDIVDNNKIYDDGALNTNYYLYDPGNKNLIQTTQIQIIENSFDGISYSENYEYNRSEFLGIEFSDTPVLFKKKINKRYFDKLRARMLKVTLDVYNLGLQRGSLVYILFKEYDEEIVSTLKKEPLEEGTGDGFVNLYTTGFYYIDGMEFVYKTEESKIIQTLYLIKKGTINTPVNKSDIPIKHE